MGRSRPEHPRPQRPWWRRLLTLFRGGSSCPATLTPDEDLQIAYRVSSDGELRHAAFHAGCVLKSNPADPRALRLLDRLVVKCEAAGLDAPDELAPLEKGGMFIGNGAVRSYVLARSGRYREAVGLLRQIAHADEAKPWWTWANDWLADPGPAGQVDPDQATGLYACLIRRHPQDAPRGGAAPAELDAALPALAALATAHPAHEMLRYLHVLAVRKSGRLDDACRAADALWSDSPSYLTAVSRAGAWSAVGDLDRAARAFEDALKYQPDDASVRADLAELHCAAGRFEEALQWADETRRYDPQGNTSATPLSFMLRYKLDRDEKWIAALRQLERERPDYRRPGERAVARLGRYLAFLPSPSEATINVASQVVAQRGPSRDKKVQLTQVAVSSIEAPSAYRAIALELGMDKLVVDVDQIPSPDPRLPRADVDWLLWEYQGTDPRPAVNAPPPLAAAAIKELALEPYDLDDWARKSVDVVTLLARELEAPADVAAAALAVMVHPPAELPADRPAWDHLQHVQVAAALVAAHADTGWEDSVRRRALISLLRGPMDWTTTAGIIALAQIYVEGLPESGRREAWALLRELANNLPVPGYCCYEDALAWAIRRLSELPGAETQGFDALWERLSASHDE